MSLLFKTFAFSAVGIYAFIRAGGFGIDKIKINDDKNAIYRYTRHNKGIFVDSIETDYYNPNDGSITHRTYVIRLNPIELYHNKEIQEPTLSPIVKLIREI